MYVAHVSYGWWATLLVGLFSIAFLAFAYACLHPMVVREVVISVLLAVNLVTFIYFCYDKAIAVHRDSIYRVPESLLLWLTFLGGSPAATLAQPLLRHKTRKREFRLPYFAIVFAHVAIVVYCFKIRARLPWSMEIPIPLAEGLQGRCNAVRWEDDLLGVLERLVA